MREYNVGIVGAGAVARAVHLPVLRSMENVRIAWITDVNADRAADTARSFRVPWIPSRSSPDDLPACDVVLLAIPVGYRTPYYEALARRDIAVFAEKPLAVTGQEHARVVGLFAPHRLACGYMRRLYSTTMLLRRAVADGWFGPLQRLRVTEGARGTRTGVDASHYDDIGAAGGGVLLTQGCHTLDLALHVTGASGFEVLRSHLEWDGEIDRKAEATIRLRGVGGREDSTCEVDYRVSWLDDQENTIELEFPQVRLCAGLQPGAAVALRPREPALGPVEEFRQGNGASTSNQAFFLEWDLFLRSLDEGKPCVVAASTAQRTAALLDALYGRAEGAA